MTASNSMNTRTGKNILSMQSDRHFLTPVIPQYSLLASELSWFYLYFFSVFFLLRHSDTSYNIFHTDSTLPSVYHFTFSLYRCHLLYMQYSSGQNLSPICFVMCFPDVYEIGTSLKAANVSLFGLFLIQFYFFSH